MKISVIIPVHNGGEDLLHSLGALAVSSRQADEIIVVDDSSDDESVARAKSQGARVVTLKGGPCGPAVARNRGVAVATGDVVVFVDSDVAVHPDALAVIERYLIDQPDVTALFGSYDDAPPGRGLVTLYKNLLHHYVHQHGNREASTFWAGCGAVRRDVFLAIGGFDESYMRPSIEDIELGTRLRRAGHRVWLCPDVQVTHLKHWKFSSLLRVDIFCRAVPWTRLILSNAQLPSDLNLDHKSRLCALDTWAILLFAALGFEASWIWIGAILAIVALGLLNVDLYRFFAKRGGMRFAIGAFALHALYFLYSSLIFGSMMAWYGSRKMGLRTSISER